MLCPTGSSIATAAAAASHGAVRLAWAMAAIAGTAGTALLVVLKGTPRRHLDAQRGTR